MLNTLSADPTPPALDFVRKREDANWLVHTLSGSHSGAGDGEQLNASHLAVSKGLLQTRCVIGLLDRLEESLARFERYFGWRASSEADRYKKNATVTKGYNTNKVSSLRWARLVTL